MAWTAPRTWVTGELVTSTIMNTHVRDNFNYLFPDVHQIASTTLGSASAGITFSSIPQTFAALMLVVFARANGTSTAADLSLRVNGDTGANYDWTATGGAGSGVAVTRWQIGRIVGSVSDSQFNSSVVVIPGYTTAQRKSFAGIGGGYTVAAGGGVADVYGGRYFAAGAAITSLVILCAALNLDTGTVATLYGMS